MRFAIINSKFLNYLLKSENAHNVTSEIFNIWMVKKPSHTKTIEESRFQVPIIREAVICL